MALWDTLDTDPEEVAEAIAWLCTDAPAYLTGAALVLDGGLVIRG